MGYHLIPEDTANRKARPESDSSIPAGQLIIFFAPRRIPSNNRLNGEAGPLQYITRFIGMGMVSLAWTPIFDKPGACSKSPS
jgi:hypothetical protein